MHHIYTRLPSRTLSISLFSSLQQYVTSPKFIKQMHAQKNVQQYSWICVHWWLLNSKSKIPSLHNNNSNSKNDNIIKWPLLWSNNWSYCLQQFTRDKVYDYGQYFDLNVYGQLKRRAGTLIWSLDDYYSYNFQQKTIQQIIVQDLFSIAAQKINKNTNQNIQKQKQQANPTTQSQSKDIRIQQKLSKAKKYINYNLQFVNNLTQQEILGDKKINWKYLTDIQHINQKGTTKVEDNNITNKQKYSHI